MSMETTVHLLRHGEVHNPEGILYGRRPGYNLSELGLQMAERVADRIAGQDITHVISSPLERAQQTAGPLAKALGVDISLDERVLESENLFVGKSFKDGLGPLKDPKVWPKLINPFKPSWGEPYLEIVARMMAAIHDARDLARGHEAVIVSHQLPIWTTRLHVEGRSFLHDPRHRQCALCSLTSLHFVDDEFVAISYSEPAGDMLPAKDKYAPFSAGDAEDAED
ncbi:histidine phosphatase family protein [Nocardioides albus]|uniref:histidine phosphatase family protein n=1 Tax=Nocardioides albus TaxID=1841 RepID=UPI0016115E9E|nr:histidine phosphatase family protein [Nocardioides albus]GGU42644.1 phosphoglycerate mutase [Nocardioides albus]